MRRTLRGVYNRILLKSNCNRKVNEVEYEQNGTHDRHFVDQSKSTKTGMIKPIQNLIRIEWTSNGNLMEIN